MSGSAPTKNHAIVRVLAGLALFFLITLGGDALTAAMGIPFPGAVLGLVVTLALLLSPAGDALERTLAPAADILVPLLPLLLVPLAVGAMGLLESLGGHAGQIAIVIVVGWAVTAGVTAGSMLLMRRLARRR
jgi:holin-like protein